MIGSVLTGKGKTMGLTVIVNSLEELCAMMCDNYVPEFTQEDVNDEECLDIPPEE